MKSRRIDLRNLKGVIVDEADEYFKVDKINDKINL